MKNQYKPSRDELIEAVEHGYAYKRNGRFFLTDLGVAMAWAQDSFPNGDIPEGGVRYKGYLITARITETEITYSLDRITQ